MSIIQLNGALQGDYGSLAAASAHIRVPKPPHIAVPSHKKQAGALFGARLLSCLFPFITVNVVPFSLLGDEVHEELPNGLAAAGGLLFHPFLLFLRLLP